MKLVSRKIWLGLVKATSKGLRMESKSDLVLLRVGSNNKAVIPQIEGPVSFQPTLQVGHCGTHSMYES